MTVIETEFLDYQDADGTWHIMAACGHRVSGSPQPGDKLAMCPNCRFLLKFQSIVVVYPDRLPDTLAQETP